MSVVENPINVKHYGNIFYSSADGSRKMFVGAWKQLKLSN